MSAQQQKKLYSPSLSEMAVISVRRLAWAMGKSMPAAVDLMVKLMPSTLDPSWVCHACKDNSKCPACIFCRESGVKDKAALLAAL
jgi:hypothetical protein